MLAQIRWHSLSMMPLVVALGVALVLAVVWLYPAQVRLPSQLSARPILAVTVAITE